MVVMCKRKTLLYAIRGLMESGRAQVLSLLLIATIEYWARDRRRYT
jgi:hypothetical protein